MQRHIVQFFSPGTFVAEMTEKPIEKWDVDQAMLIRLLPNGARC